MPMGGLGSRFSKEGYLAPKPLIDVNGTPMYRKALSSFDEIKDNVSFFSVVRAEHEEKFGLASSLESEGVRVKIFHGSTGGAAETALLGLDLLDKEAPLVVVDCDVRFRSSEFLESLFKNPPPYSGAVTYFHSSDSRYSFAEIDSTGLVIRTAEKKVISTNALIGCYAFSSASLFEEAARRQIVKGLQNPGQEHFMSPVFNSLIQNGGIVRAYRGEADSFGTPEELQNFLMKN